MPICYYLYSFQGAFDGVHWDALSPATKELLKDAGVPQRASRSNRRAKARGSRGFRPALTVARL